MEIGDKVVGTSDNIIIRKVIVGEITDKVIDEVGNVKYKVRGATIMNPFGKSLTFSGDLKESEIEITDQRECNKIIELYLVVIKQIITGDIQYQRTLEQINEIRHIHKNKQNREV